MCGAPIVVTMASRDRMAVTGTGPIAFRGTGEFSDEEFGSREAIELFGGMVRLPAQQRLTRRRVIGGVVRMDLSLATMQLHDLPIPCGALELSDGPLPGAAGDAHPAETPALLPIDEGQWTTRARVVWFRERPGSGRSVRVSDVTSLQRVARRGDWWRMTAHDDASGVRVVGWLPSRLLRSVDSIGIGNIGTSGHGIGTASGHIGLGPGDFYGRADLVDGATVYAERGSFPWATVRGRAVGRVLVRRGSEWAELMSASSVEDDCRTPVMVGSFQGHAFLRIGDVHPLEAPATEAREVTWRSCE